MNKTTFSVGDRVEAWRSYDGMKPAGIGSVVKIHHHGIEVDFPCWDEGHCGSSEDAGARSRWFYAFENYGTRALRNVTELAATIGAKKAAGFKVEKNIPLPARQIRRFHRTSKYPFARMKVGDSFAIKGGDRAAMAVRQAVHGYQRKAKGQKFSVRRFEESYRCWRLK